MLESAGKTTSALALAIVLAATKAIAGPNTDPSKRAEPWVEAWSGADWAQDVWSLYSGATAAPFGSLQSPGWRLRAVAGYGHYEAWSQNARQHVSVMKQFTEVLAGYQAHLGTTTLKLLAGYHYVSFASDAADAPPDGKPEGHGLKVSLETWTWLSDRVWLNADASFTSLRTTYDVRARLGWVAAERFSLGPELGFIGDESGERFSAGAFARYEWSGGEARISAGGAGKEHDSLDLYLSTNLLLRF